MWRAMCAVNGTSKARYPLTTLDPWEIAKFSKNQFVLKERSLQIGQIGYQTTRNKWSPATLCCILFWNLSNPGIMAWMWPQSVSNLYLSILNPILHSCSNLSGTWATFPLKKRSLQIGYQTTWNKWSPVTLCCILLWNLNWIYIPDFRHILS